MAQRSSRRRSTRARSGTRDRDRPSNDEVEAAEPEEEAADAEKEPGRFARISTGWKGISGVIATIGTAVGVLTTLGLIGGGGGAAGPSEAVASAASKTAQAGSSSLRVMVIETPRGAAAGSGDTIVGSGQLDYREGRGRIEYDLSRRRGSEDMTAVEVVFNGPAFYVRDPGALGLPKGKRWVRVAFDDITRVQDGGGELAVLSELRIDDPTKTVASLEENSSGAKEVGEEPLYGVTTKHYRAQRDPDGQGPTPPTTVDAWVDEAGYLRKVETVTEGPGATTKTRTELDEFGVTVDARPPPSSQVLDLARLLRGG